MQIIKLGGSVITYKKSRKPRFKRKVMDRLAKEIRDSGQELVIVHGAGSFGHPLASKYELHLGYKNKRQLKGIAEVQRDVKNLNLKVMNALIDAGIKAVSVAPIAFIKFENGMLRGMDKTIFRKYLGLGLTPVTFGDVVLDERKGICICSGDDLMLALARDFRPKRAIFVIDEDGIYPHYPRNLSTGVLEIVGRKEFEELRKEERVRKGDALDITGSIMGKLEKALKISRFSEVLIVNGNVDDRVKESLLGKKVICTKVSV